MDNNAGNRDGRGEPVIVHARVVDTTMSSAQWSSLLRSRLTPVQTGEVVAEVHTARAGNAYLVFTSGPSGTRLAVEGPPQPSPPTRPDSACSPRPPPDD